MTFVYFHAPYSERRKNASREWEFGPLIGLGEGARIAEVVDYDERVWPLRDTDATCFCGNDLWLMSCGCQGADDI